MSVPEDESQPRVRLSALPPASLLLIAFAVLAVGLAVAPFYGFRPDMRDYWIPWQYATGGFRPWNAYSLPTCNYPPVVLYVLSVVEAARHALDVSWKASTNRFLMKLPNIAAHLIGAASLYRAFVSSQGRWKSSLLAAGWLLSLNLFVNAVLWGQWDVILSLFLLLALLAFRTEQLGRCGFWVALALATKVQAIFIVPVLGIYLLARRDFRGIGRATLGAIFALVMVFGPMALAGRLRESTSIYLASVDTFPYRTLDAWNYWFVLDVIDMRLLGGSRYEVILDHRPMFPAISMSFSFKKFGLVLFASYAVATLIAVARRRTIADVIVGVPLMGTAMYMLATQMHERYIAPPAALMVLWLLLPRPYRVHFIYWSFVAGVDQLLVLARFGVFGPALQFTTGFSYTGAVFSCLNIALFIHLSRMFFSKRFRRDAAALDEKLIPAEPLPAH